MNPADVEGPCTDCEDTGVTIQTERTCTCDAGTALCTQSPMPERELLKAILSAQTVQPYRGWSITKLNKAVDAARAHLGLPSIRDLNPDIAAMQDAVAKNGAALTGIAETPIPAASAELVAGEQYLIRKGAYYYRPKAQGYTSDIAQAGRYSLEDAIRYSHPNGSDGPRDDIDYMPAPTAQAHVHAKCTASPYHSDILQTIENAGPKWKDQGYPSALAEVRDMANVGRALIAELPDDYRYNDCPSEIVADLQNERDDAFQAGAKAGLEAAAKAIIAEHRPTKPEAEWTRRDGTRAHYASKGASVIRALDPKQIAESANCSATVGGGM